MQATESKPIKLGKLRPEIKQFYSAFCLNLLYLGIGDPTLLDNLKSSKTWSQAAIQIFFSLGVGFGGLLTMGSYNKFSNNIARDSMLLCCINCGTSFFAGFVIFSIIGNMGFLIGKESIGDLKALTKGGNAGLAFIAYPQALGNMPGSHFWSICFFFIESVEKMRWKLMFY